MSTRKPTILDNEAADFDYKLKETTGSLLVADSFASEVKGKKGLSRILKATGYSIDGF